MRLLGYCTKCLVTFKNFTFLFLNFYWLALLVAYVQSVKISLGFGRSNGPKFVLKQVDGYVTGRYKPLSRAFARISRIWSASSCMYGPGQLNRYSDSLRLRRSRDWIPVGGEIFHPFPDRPCNPSSLLYHGYCVSCRGIKRTGNGVNHPPQSSTEVNEGVELYLPLRVFMACSRANVTFVLPLVCSFHLPLLYRNAAVSSRFRQTYCPCLWLYPLFLCCTVYVTYSLISFVSFISGLSV